MAHWWPPSQAMIIISYLIIGPLHHLQPHLFQEKGTGASGVVSHLPKEMRCNGDAVLQHPHGATHAMSSACAAPPMDGKVLAWSSRRKTRCWEIRHGKSQQTEPLPSPDLSASWPPANKKYQQLATRPRLQNVWNAVNLVSYGFQKENEAHCVTCWFGKFLLRHIHFSKHKIPKPLPTASSKAGCTLSTCWHCPMTSVKELSGNGFRCECVPKCNQAAEQCRGSCKQLLCNLCEQTCCVIVMKSYSAQGLFFSSGGDL